MDINDAVVRTFVKRGRLVQKVSDTRYVVQWEDGSQSEETILDLDYGTPQPLDKVMAHAERRVRGR